MTDSQLVIDVRYINKTFAGSIPALVDFTAQGTKMCQYGCHGLGNCARACPFDAIVLKDGVIHIDEEKCTGCGVCVEACPRDLFIIMPTEQKLIVQCRSLLEGDEAEALCKVACNGCGLCATDGAPGLIHIDDGLAVIDYELNQRAEPKATERCPTGAITWVEAGQLQREPAAFGSET